MATITKRNGRWFVQVRKSGLPSQSKTFDNKAEAREWAAETEVRLARGLDSGTRAQRSMSLAELLKRYRSEVTMQKRGASSELLRLEKVGRDDIGKVAIGKLKPSHFAEYRDRRLAEVMPATVARELGLLRHALEVARKEWGLPLEANPVDRVRKPSGGTARSRRLTPDDQARLWAALVKTRNPVVTPMVRLAIETGMRRGELLALRWADIDLQRRTAHLPLTKNGHSRTVPLSPAALAILEGLKSSSQPDADRVFATTAEAFKLAWQRAVRRAGLDDLHFHDLRHEAVSRFFEFGLSMPEVASISGHRDPRMLFRYTHLRAEDIAGKLAGQGRP